MPSHVHTAPQCGFWTGHDPSCFDQAFGVERDCILIEVGKNKGSYLCIHERAPFTSAAGSRDEILVTATPLMTADDPHSPGRFARYLPVELADEYPAIAAELRPPAPAEC